MPNDNRPEQPMTAAEVAIAFRVDRKTVTRWAKEGGLPSFRTPGGHLRFRAAEIRALLQPEPEPKP